MCAGATTSQIERDWVMRSHSEKLYYKQQHSTASTHPDIATAWLPHGFLNKIGLYHLLWNARHLFSEMRNKFLRGAFPYVLLKKIRQINSVI